MLLFDLEANLNYYYYFFLKILVIFFSVLLFISVIYKALVLSWFRSSKVLVLEMLNCKWDCTYTAFRTCLELDTL